MLCFEAQNGEDDSTGVNRSQCVGQSDDVGVSHAICVDWIIAELGKNESNSIKSFIKEINKS